MSTTLKKITLFFGITLFLLVYLWGCYEINFEVASKMNWLELIVPAVAMISGLGVALSIVWIVRVSVTGNTYPFVIKN